MFMISGFSELLEPVFIDLNIPNYYKDHKKTDGHSFGIYYLCKAQNVRNQNVNYGRRDGDNKLDLVGWVMNNWL